MELSEKNQKSIIEHFRPFVIDNCIKNGYIYDEDDIRNLQIKVIDNENILKIKCVVTPLHAVLEYDVSFDIEK